MKGVLNFYKGKKTMVMEFFYRYMRKKHQYLIEQLQFNNKQTLNTTHELNFDNPVKELIWVCFTLFDCLLL